MGAKVDDAVMFIEGEEALYDCCTMKYWKFLKLKETRRKPKNKT